MVRERSQRISDRSTPSGLMSGGGGLFEVSSFSLITREYYANVGISDTEWWVFVLRPINSKTSAIRLS